MFIIVFRSFGERSKRLHVLCPLFHGSSTAANREVGTLRFLELCTYHLNANPNIPFSVSDASVELALTMNEAAAADRWLTTELATANYGKHQKRRHDQPCDAAIAVATRAQAREENVERKQKSPPSDSPREMGLPTQRRRVNAAVPRHPLASSVWIPNYCC
ncbi:hypothetical protein BHE74_00022143 [Ensete ventricosum]|nr:hypothetical protein BHE74_00022143 [Ensete ventricosum]